MPSLGKVTPPRISSAFTSEFRLERCTLLWGHVHFGLYTHMRPITHTGDVSNSEPQNWGWVTRARESWRSRKQAGLLRQLWSRLAASRIQALPLLLRCDSCTIAIARIARPANSAQSSCSCLPAPAFTTLFMHATPWSSCFCSVDRYSFGR